MSGDEGTHYTRSGARRKASKVMNKDQPPTKRQKTRKKRAPQDTVPEEEAETQPDLTTLAETASGAPEEAGRLPQSNSDESLTDQHARQVREHAEVIRRNDALRHTARSPNIYDSRTPNLGVDHVQEEVEAEGDIYSQFTQAAPAGAVRPTPQQSVAISNPDVGKWQVNVQHIFDWNERFMKMLALMAQEPDKTIGDFGFKKDTLEYIRLTNAMMMRLENQPKYANACLDLRRILCTAANIAVTEFLDEHESRSSAFAAPAQRQS